MMGTLMMIAAATLLAGGEPATIAQDLTEQQHRLHARQARREICYALATGAVDLNLADCLSFDNAAEPVFRTEVCDFLRETEQLEAFKFASHSECIRYGFVR
jgi:hypothetical protein